MCHKLGTRQSLKVHRVSTVQTHGEQTPTPSASPDGVFSLFSPCAYIYTRRKDSPCARLLTHGKQGLRRPCSCRRRFAVGHRRRSLRRVLTVLRRVPRAHGELVVSGSGSLSSHNTLLLVGSCGSLQWSSSILHTRKQTPPAWELGLMKRPACMQRHCAPVSAILGVNYCFDKSD